MRIIFYDGTCPMCNTWVKRIIRWDRRKLFRFSPLEGAMAKSTLHQVLPDYVKEDTIIYYDDGKVFLRSDATLQIMHALGFPYVLFTAGYIVPKPIRDSIYRWVARRRYRYGERYLTCPVPPEEWKELFLK